MKSKDVTPQGLDFSHKRILRLRSAKNGGTPLPMPSALWAEVGRQAQDAG
ncbi:MAG TPA: hypothetical protein VF326_09450 [Anaerolineaceae bacterium]